MAECCAISETGKPPAVLSCPASGTRCKRVDLLTVRSLVRALPLGMPPTHYYFCEEPHCDVVYFPSNPSAPVFRRADLEVRVWQKDQDDTVPVCYCFGFTRGQIQQEVTQTGRAAIAEKIKSEVRARNCACEVKNPSGKCCLGDVGRVAKDARARWAEK